MSTKLICNEANGVQRDVIVGLNFNVAAVKTRLDKLEGRDYTVVPMVMLLPGVHNGSGGPLYYPDKELSKTPEAWDHKPVVVYHPQDGISACSPEILNSRKVGLILNTKYKKGRLTAEAWIDMERARAVHERIVPAIENHEVMELSTGVFVDVENTPGEWNKESYTGIAMNYRPDHLALLPDKIGACSVKDGAGFIRNEAQFRKFMSELDDRGYKSNEMSFSNIEQALRGLLIKKLGTLDPAKGPWPWIAAVYSNFFIYELDGKNFLLSYTTSDTDEITLGDEPVKEVHRVTEWRTVEGSFVGNRDQSPKPEENDMDKITQIAAILAANKGWSPKDKPALEAMTDDQIKTIHNGVVGPAPAAPATTNTTSTPVTPPVAVPPATAPVAPVPAPANVVPMPATLPVVNSQTSVEDYLKAMPAEIQNSIRASLRAGEQEKANLIGIITANSQNGFTKEELQSFPIETLRSVAKLAAKPVENTEYAPLYAGLAPVRDTVIGNESKEEPLTLPTMKFERPGSKRGVA